ncbi:right-handed parallel beta-helix repeat-containing protein [Bacillus toyonensis]|uniref:right-handed parallel beta-helix repeat-containing protein n=1 Tax=Bacillus toyonensis TaxID=155322 RepID=UPI0002795A26|nr:right-handed parallel beta-helix repeat-containing protein [Bacillus toyonensis]EJQ77819.1 hypothetical protein IGO_05638 [Bacillus toyonensis]
MTIKDLGTNMDRQWRIDLNDNFRELSGMQGSVNDAVDKAKTAEQIANEAKAKADAANNTSNSVQEQLDTIVINGDSSVEAAQARVDEKGIAHETLKVRLDLDSLKVGNLLDLGTDPRSLAKSLSEREVNVKDFGAKGNGINDDTVPTQNAINYLSTLGGGVVRIPSGKFKINSSINVPSNIQLLGVGHSTIIDATGLPKGTALNQVKLFKIEGKLDVISTTPTSNITALSVSLPVLNINGFKQNDMILVTSDEPYAPGTANSSWKKGEIQIVKGVTDSKLDLSGAMLFGYDYTQNGKVNRIDVVENVVISNMKLVLGGIGNAHNAISCRYARNILIDNLIIEDAEDTSINLFYCYNCTIRRNTISNSTSPTPLGNTGYGIGVLDACRELQIYENTLSNCRHGVAGGGARPSVLIQVFNNKAYGCRINFAYDCHEPCFYWSFRGNLADGCNGGIVVRGQYIVIDNNDIINSTGKGIRVESYTPVTNQFSITIRNNRIKYCQDIGIDIDGYQSRLREVIVQGNVIDGTVTKGINLYNFQSGEVSNNYILNTSGIGIYAGGTTGSRSSELTMRDNTVNYSASANIYLEFIDRILCSSNKTKNSTTREGLFASTCNELQIEGGLFRDSFTYGIYINGGNKHSISNARCSVTTDSNGDGVRVLNVTDLSINGGIYDSNPRFGIYISGSNFLVVRGVNARNNSNATKINIDENATNKIVDGNLI